MAMNMRAQTARVAGRRVAAPQARLLSAPRTVSRVSTAARFADVSIDLRSVARATRSRQSVVVEAVKKSVGDLKKSDLEGKRVFVRADLNVPLDKVRSRTGCNCRGIVVPRAPAMRPRCSVVSAQQLLHSIFKLLLTLPAGQSGAATRATM